MPPAGGTASTVGTPACAFADVVEIFLNNEPSYCFAARKAPSRRWLEAQRKFLEPVVIDEFFRMAHEERSSMALEKRDLTAMERRQCLELLSLVRKLVRYHSRDSGKARPDVLVGGKRFVVVEKSDDEPTLGEDIYFLADCRHHDKYRIPFNATHVLAIDALHVVAVPGPLRDCCDEKVYKARNMQSLWLPNTTRVGTNALRNSTRLSTLLLPRVKQIMWRAFSGCSSLIQLSFPQLKVVGEGAFAHCSSLTTVTFPRVEHVLGDAFLGCSHLTTIKTPDGISVWGKLVDESVSITRRFKHMYMDQIEEGREVIGPIEIIFSPHVKVSKHAFRGCSKLQDISGCSDESVIEGGPVRHCA